MMVKEEFSIPASSIPATVNDFKNKKELPDNKERTLFCINIDPKCTEDILYELFLQAGPIEQIKRKEDKNGNLICLITYKHVVSCDYAINIFNGISLYGTSLKVQFSQQPGPQDRRRQSINNYQNIRETGRDGRDSRDCRDGRDQRRDESRRLVSYDHLTPTDSPVDSRNLSSLTANQFMMAEFGTGGSGGSSYANPYSDMINRNVASNFNFEGENNNNGHQSRRNNNMNNSNNNNSGRNNNNRGYSNDNRGGDMWRNQSNNGRNNNNNNGYSNNRNGSYDNRNRSRDGNNRFNDNNNNDRSRSPHEMRRRNNRY